MQSTNSPAGTAPAEHDAGEPANLHNQGFLALTVGAIGVVFGDIGTSPLYAFREALAQAASDGLYREEVIGVMSLALWALILIVTVKYVLFLMRADNEGEGGVLALLALAQRGAPKPSMIVLGLGAIGAALFYGDAVITPSLSVLSAVEGLKSLPSIGDGFGTDEVLVIALAILVSLFTIQSRGTAMVSKLFGPVCIVWFFAIAAIGLIHIADGPGIIAAFLPWHAVMFIATHGVLGLFVLGAVFLTVTGAEALTADMGHFGRAPIRAAWLVLVFPALALNYLGQGAFALHTLDDANRLGKPFENLDWFFLMIPAGVRLPMVLLACLATIIASQAVITGAYSLTQQAMQLGLLPRLKIKQTSAGNAGQIYIGAVNWLLLAGVIALALGFRTSSAMAAAYGIAVTGTMVVTCCLAYVVIRRQWHWSVALSLATIIPFLTIDLVFFGANILRVVEGGWVPLMIGAAMLLVIWTWVRGRRVTARLEDDGAVPMDQMANALVRRPPTEVEGTAIFLTARGDLTPHALLHNIKHNHVLHHDNVILTVRTRRMPYVDPAERFEVERINDRFTRVTLNYGFMEAPDVHVDVASARGVIPDGRRASYFIGRNNYIASSEVGMPVWQDLLFIALHRNAADPTDYFGIPSNRVIELGAQFTI